LVDIVESPEELNEEVLWVGERQRIRQRTALELIRSVQQNPAIDMCVATQGLDAADDHTGLAAPEGQQQTAVWRSGDGVQSCLCKTRQWQLLVHRSPLSWLG
jgi:hypothetical protein